MARPNKPTVLLSRSCTAMSSPALPPGMTTSSSVICASTAMPAAAPPSRPIFWPLARKSTTTWPCGETWIGGTYCWGGWFPHTTAHGPCYSLHMPCLRMVEAVSWSPASATWVWCGGLGAFFNKAPENAWWIETSPTIDWVFCSAGEGRSHGLQAGPARVISFP